MILALLVGSMTAMGSALGIGWALGLNRTALISLLPKSATAPVAIGISKKLGGARNLTAVLVILTGIIGAIVVTSLLNALRLTGCQLRGFAIAPRRTGSGPHGPSRSMRRPGLRGGLAWG